MKKGQDAVFGVGIRNPGATKEFSMALGFSNAYTPDGRLMDVDRDFIERNWLGSFAETETFLIDKNSEVVKPVLIKSASSGFIGDYVFNVCVYPGIPVPCNAVSYRSNSDKFYSGRIHQVTVRIR